MTYVDIAQIIPKSTDRYFRFCLHLDPNAKSHWSLSNTENMEPKWIREN